VTSPGASGLPPTTVVLVASAVVGVRLPPPKVLQ
jgi:hypothetical protein